MTVREIAILTAELLRAEDAVTELASGESDDQDVKMIVRCVNFAAAELCGDGYPICRTDSVCAVGKVIALGNLSGVPSAVREVKRLGKFRVAFSVDTRGIFVPSDGRYTVTYTVVPPQKREDEELEVGALCDRETVAYLAARNYCLMTGRYDEASVWDQRYVDESGKKRLARRATLPARAWR